MWGRRTPAAPENFLGFVNQSGAHAAQQEDTMTPLEGPRERKFAHRIDGGLGMMISLIER